MKLEVRSSIDRELLARVVDVPKARMKEAIKTGMTQGAAVLKTAGQKHISDKLKIKRKSALNAWSSKTLAHKSEAKPTAIVAKLSQDWMLSHEKGSTIAAKGFMVIWFAGVRKMKAKTLQQKLAAKELAILREEGGQRLFIYRVGKTKTGRDRKPKLLGMLVRRVTMKRKLDVNGVVSAGKYEVAKRLEANIERALQAPMNLNTTTMTVHG